MKKQYQSTILIIILAVSLFAPPVRVAAEQYTYDSMGRVQRVVYEDGTYEEYQYDSNGNIKSVKQYGSTGQLSSGDASGEGSTTQESQGQGEASTTQSQTGQGETTTTQASGEQGGNTTAQADGGDGTNTAVDEDGSSSLLEQTTAFIDHILNDTSKLTVGKVYKKGTLNYKVTSIEKRTVQVVSVVKGKTSKKKYTIPATVRLKGCTLKVTSIGSKAFHKCSKCKKIVLKSKTIKSIHKNAFTGLKKGMVIQVPKKCYKKYVKYIKKTKSYKQLKIKKSLL